MSLRTVVLTFAVPVGLLACSASSDKEVTSTQSAAVTSTETGLLESTNGFCLDVFANDHNTGAAVDIATCNGTTAQTFTVPVGGPGPIVNTSSGLCLDDVWGGGAVLQMVTCMGTPEQQWTFQGFQGYFPTSTKIVGATYGHCVDVLGDNQRNGQTVDPATCNGTAAQVWSFQVQACPTGETVANNTCVACGAKNQIPCAGDTCNPGLGNVYGVICCPPSSIESDGQCAPCGTGGLTVCGGNWCDTGFTPVNGTCKQCGASGEPCCTSGEICGGGLSCLGSECGTPPPTVHCAAQGQTGTCCSGLEPDQNNGDKCEPKDPANCGLTTIGDAPPCCKNKKPECQGDGICVTDNTTSPPYSYCCSPSAQSCQ